jgi:hypothetical protein
MRTVLQFTVRGHDIPEKFTKHYGCIKVERLRTGRACVRVKNFPILPVGSQVVLYGVHGVIESYFLGNNQLEVMINAESCIAYDTLSEGAWEDGSYGLTHQDTFDYAI